MMIIYQFGPRLPLAGKKTSIAEPLNRNFNVRFGDQLVLHMCHGLSYISVKWPKDYILILYFYCLRFKRTLRTFLISTF